MSESKTHTVLVVDDDSSVLDLVFKFLEKTGYAVIKASCFGDAQAHLDKGDYEILISDIMMAGKDGIELLRYSHERWVDKPVILMTGYAQLKFAIEAIKNGAFDFIQKPLDFDHLKRVVWKASEFARLKKIEKNYTEELESEIYRRREELKKAMLELENTRNEVIKLSEEKSSFLSTVSHEMRTPLNGIVGAIDLLKGTELRGKQGEYLALGDDSVERLAALIEELLTFRNSKESVDEVYTDFMEIREQISALFSKMKPKFNEKRITFSNYVDPEIERFILTDGEKLIRVIEIFLDNALKFTDKGGVILDVSSIGEYESKLVRIMVSDTGIGVPEGMEERIFEPFVQGEQYLTRKHEGAGVGLAIARQNAALIGGRVWCEREDSGSRFFLEVPTYSSQKGKREP